MEVRYCKFLCPYVIGVSIGSFRQTWKWVIKGTGGLGHRKGDAPIVGVTKESHVADAAAAASVEMSDAEVTALESLADTLGIKRNPLLGEGNGLNDYCSVIASPFHR